MNLPYHPTYLPCRYRLAANSRMRIARISISLECPVLFDGHVMDSENTVEDILEWAFSVVLRAISQKVALYQKFAANQMAWRPFTANQMACDLSGYVVFLYPDTHA